MSVVSFYYYLKVLKQVYVFDAETGASPILVPMTTRIVLWATAALIMILGCLPDLLLNRIATTVGSALH
jgi:NADH:ubiquinone oxidoreductase subunit 2 (subunit N)